MRYLTETFRMCLHGLLDISEETYPHWSNLTSFVMTYHDHSNPIKTNIYKPAKNLDIGLKLSEYDHMGYLISFRRPTLTGPT